jgi:hypothetical protein
MKNKSFLFLIAALAMGLAFAGCSSDDGGSTEYIKQGYAGPIADINAAFAAGVPTVYLTRDTEFSDGDDEMLIIPSNKTLDLNGYTLTDSSPGYLVVDGTLKWDKDNESPVTLEQSYIIAGKDYLNTNVGTLSDANTKDRAIIVYGGSLLSGGSAVASGGTIEAGATYFALKADKLNSDPGNEAAAAMPGFILGDLTLNNGFTYTGGGIGLIITGDLTLKTAAGTIGGGGTVTVIGKLTDEIGSTAAGTAPKVAGTLSAANIESAGGIFNILKLTSDKASIFKSDAVAIGDFSAKGPVTFEKDVAGTIIAENVIFNGKVNAYPTSKVNKVTFGNDAIIIGNGLEGTTATLKGALKIGSAATGGTFTVSQPLTLGSGQSIVLGANGGFGFVNAGALTSDNYSLSGGAGSILNTTVNGGTVTLTNAGLAVGGPGGTATIVFSDDILLNFTKSGTISNITLDVTSGGTIGIAAGSMLTIKDAGSIVTNTQGGSHIAYANNTGSLAIIIAETSSGGSLMAGTAHANSAAAGSIGTTSISQITNGSGIGFVIVGSSSTGLLPGVTLSSYANVTGGSIAVFNVNSNGAFPTE